jgi:hypothetical protein
MRGTSRCVLWLGTNIPDYEQHIKLVSVSKAMFTSALALRVASRSEHGPLRCMRPARACQCLVVRAESEAFQTTATCSEQLRLEHRGELRPNYDAR